MAPITREDSYIYLTSLPVMREGIPGVRCLNDAAHTWHSPVQSDLIPDELQRLLPFSGPDRDQTLMYP